MSMSYCFGGTHHSERLNQIEYEKMKPETRNSWKVSKLHVVFVLALKTKALVCKRLEDKIFLQNINMDTVVLCRIRHGVIETL